MKFDIRGTTVLVTGAAHGMGRLYALRAAHDGASHVVLWDVDEPGLAECARRVERLGAAAVVQRVDVADPRSVSDAAAQVEKDLGAPDVVMNNAGVVRAGWFWEYDPQRDMEATVQVDALGPMRVARALLPGMVADASRPRRLLNVASAAGLVESPRMSAYAAAKWAVVGWSQTLRIELRQAGYDHVKVTTFCPTFVDTGMFAGAGQPLLTSLLTPTRAASAAWKAMLAGRPTCLVPWTVQLAKVLHGVLPTRAWDAVGGELCGVYHTMERFAAAAQERA